MMIRQTTIGNWGNFTQVGPLYSTNTGQWEWWVHAVIATMASHM